MKRRTSPAKQRAARHREMREFQLRAERDVPGGYPSLDESGLLDVAQVPTAGVDEAGAVPLAPDGEAVAGAAVESTDSRLLALTDWLRLKLARVLQPASGTTGWTSGTSGSGTSFYLHSAQYATAQRALGFVSWPTLALGTAGAGTNAIVVRPSSGGQLWLADNTRFVFHAMAANPTAFSTLRFGVWGNNATPAATGRPAYGVWWELDAATNGNANLWFCAANGGAVSTADTGIAFDATRRVWLFDFASTTSCAAWELVTSTSTARATLTTGLPSGGTPQTVTPFWQALRDNTIALDGKFGPVNGDIGLLLDTNLLSYELPA